MYLVASRNFKCSFHTAKTLFYKSFNSVFGRVGRLASEEVIVELLQAKCLPVILYGLDACPLNAADKHSLDFVLNRSLMKIFKTGSLPVVDECRWAFNLKLLSETVVDRKINFLLKYSCCINIVCKLFATEAVRERGQLLLTKQLG